MSIHEVKGDATTPNREVPGNEKVHALRYGQTATY
jgi:hypothetical protein